MMTLKQGRFYKDGSLVPIEFGNKEQIKLLDKVRQLKEDGCVAFVDEREDDTVMITFTCVCGHQLQKALLFTEWNNGANIDETKQCKCGLTYFMDGETYNPMVIFKLVNTKDKQ